MAESLTGGCMCGAIRFECAAEPLVSFNCHCRDCQKATGSAFTPAVIVPANSLRVTGQAKHHSVKADSGSTMTRSFCPQCGSRLFGQTSRRPEMIGILAGALDDPTRHRPTVEFWTSSAQPWDHMDPAIQKLPKNPPA